MAITLEIKGFKEVMDDIGALPKVVTAVSKRAMEEATSHIKSAVKNKITDEDINVHGAYGLLGSVHSTASSSRGKVYVGKEYGIYVEKGTRPHWPPTEPILEWVRKKGANRMGFTHLYGTRKSGATYPKRSMGANAEFSSLAYLVRRKISRVGTKPHPFFYPTVEENMDFVKQVFSKIPEALVQWLAGHPGFRVTR